MLKFLHIENIAVIERSDIEFSEGLNVLTGETGAGKSIIIDAINAVLGERTTKELIRAGCDSAEVSAVFGRLDTVTSALLDESGFSPDEDGNLVIRRRLSTTGKGLIKINEKPTTAAQLKDIGRNLINIHGQHDNQALLDPDKHGLYIDAVAENSDILDSYYEEFKSFNRIRKELLGLETDEDAKQRQIDLLKYQINELETAAVKVGEIDELKHKLEIAENYEATLTALNNAYYSLKGNDEFDGSVTLMTAASKNLLTVNEKNFKDASVKINELISAAEDISADIRDYLDNSEFSEIDSDKINQRLDFIYRLMLKYGNSEQAMLDFLKSARQQLESIIFSDKKVAALSAELDASTERLVALADTLSASRKNAAEDFTKQVSDVLSYLNMPNVRFIVDFKKGRYTKRGCDIIEFLISPNEGEDVKPLHKIASGGELSRIMLAIKSALLDNDSVGTMIFDEIDSGISGFAAGKVGIQLKRVSKNRQVICVTHLAQIAAMADNHLLIEKNVENGRTFTKVEPLSYDRRISEIARIMSGTELTENLYNSAKELVDRSIQDDNL